MSDGDLSTNPLLEQRYRSFGQLVRMMLVFALGSFYFGYGLAYFSSIEFDSILKIYNISWSKEFAQGILTGCIPIGGGIGALSSDILIKRFSRRQFLLIVNSAAIIVGLLLYIQDQYSLLIVRILQGCCVGLYSAIGPVIVKELSPTQISGSLGVISQFHVCSGIFFAYTLKFILSKIADDENGDTIWVYVFGFPLILVILQTLMLIFVYPFETPKYLLQNKREKEARDLIMVIYKDEFVEEVITEKYTDLGQSVNAEPQANTTSVLTDGPNESLIKSDRKSNKIPTIIALHLALLQQFVGVNAVVAYGGQIAAEAIPSVKATFPIIINAQQVLTAFVVSYLLSRVGRRTILLWGCVGSAVATGIIAIGYFIKDSNDGLGSSLILTGLAIFMANFGVSLGPVIWLYIPEIVQPSIVPYSTGVNWGGAAAVMIFFPILKPMLPNQNPAPLFLFFCLWTVVSLFFNAKFCVETKGKTQKQIEAEFAKLA